MRPALHQNNTGRELADPVFSVLLPDMLFHGLYRLPVPEPGLELFIFPGIRENTQLIGCPADNLLPAIPGIGNKRIIDIDKSAIRC